MLSHRWIGDVGPTHPPAVEDQTGHAVRVHGRPRCGDHCAERGAQQIHSTSADCFHHGAQRFELQIHRWRARAVAREPTARLVVANERPAAGQHLVVAALRWHRPAQLEVGQPPGDVDQWRTITRPGEGHVGTVIELHRIDRLFQRPRFCPRRRPDGAPPAGCQRRDGCRRPSDRRASGAAPTRRCSYPTDCRPGWPTLSSRR